MSKKKKEKGLISAHEMHSALNRLASRISLITTKSEFDKAKVELIKLYAKIKQNPVLFEFDGKRIELLKECNINIQFLNRDEDVWNLISNGKLEDAYEEIIATTKAISDHPDRHHIKSWISSQIRESLRKIADLATSIPKKENQDKTIMPQRFSSTASPIDALPTNKSIKPGLGEPLNPFSLSDFSSQPTQNNPFDQNKPRTTATLQPSKDFETIFKPTDIVSPFEKTFRPKNLTPTSSENQTYIAPNAKKVQKPNENSIKTFWVREEDQDPVLSKTPDVSDTPFKDSSHLHESDPFKKQTKKK